MNEKQVSDLVARKEKELNEVVEKEAQQIIRVLVSNNAGMTVMEFRKETLHFIDKNQINPKVSQKVKELVNEYILNLKIPTQK